jgi:ATP-dependent helicase/nuclease subunit B
MTTTPGLFDGPAPRLRAVSASAPFLDTLADAMVRALGPPASSPAVVDRLASAERGLGSAAGEDAGGPSDPFALSDALVLLPNRRAMRGLIDAFAAHLGGAALLPAMRPLGDLDDDVDIWGAEPIDIEAPPAMQRTRQRMELAALIRARDKAAGGIEDPARALALADDLGKLLDSAAAADDVRWDALPTLVSEKDLARHWEMSAAFLGIVAEYWPQRLQADGLADPGARRSLLLRALAKEWERTPPERPIIIAGSTGSIAATRALMRVVARLPKGVVLLPGVDVDLDDDAWDAVGDQHPQHALKQTLAALGVARGELSQLGAESDSGRDRRVLLREALAPAEKTSDWLARVADAGGPEFVRRGANGVRLLEAATENEEAGAIALLLREAMEAPGRTAALVTPDAGLARRVEAKLARWNIAPSVSHGRPLRETEAGVLMSLLCALASDACEPVSLAGLLKHPRVHVGADVAARTTLEHHALRGPRRFETFAELAGLEELAKWPRALEMVARVEEALAPLAEAMARDTLTLAQFADALTLTIENSCAAAAWQGADGENAADLLREAIAHGGDMGAMAPRAAPRVLMRLMDDREVPPPAGGDPRIAIWGPLEARLQRRDLMILGGLNEGVWPAPPAEDPFLSRPMRAALGLPSLDERIGLAAHDFAQLASAQEVVLTRALRREGSPTLASRWLWRLKTLVEGAKQKLARADDAVRWARALDEPRVSRPARAPEPRPPASARLKRISVTQVETLIRDPYAIYARRILGIDVLQSIGEIAGPAERGIAIHRAVERFEDGADPALLAALLDEELRRAGVAADRRAAERARLEVSVAALIAWLKARAAAGDTVYREMKGELPLACGVELSGVADRIEIGVHGAAILDFKTGQPPTDSQVQSGLAPQLPLEAAMLKRGAFKDMPAARVRELLYWRIGNTDPAPRVLSLEGGPEGAGENALARLEAMLREYARDTQAFYSKPRVQFVKRYADYDQLARRKEWADAESDE